MQKINLPKELMDKVRERLTAILAEKLDNRAVKSTYATKDGLCKVIDAAAKETDTNPTDEQREAGNYRKGKFRLHGLEIAIENPRGSERHSKANAPKPWSVTMNSHYGYIKKHISEADGDHVDVFIGPHPESQYVAVVDQAFGDKFDEHKVMLGFRNAAEAKAAYLASYSPGWKGFRAITPMTMDQFKGWLENGDTSKPMAEQAIKYARLKSGSGQGALFFGHEERDAAKGMPEGKWGVTEIGDKQFEQKHPRDGDGKFKKKVGQANLFLWGPDGEANPDINAKPRDPITHDINVDAREAAAHAFHKALHAAGKISEPPKHPAPANIAEMKQAAGFDDDQGLVLFRHGDTLRAHGNDAARFAEVNGGKDSAPASSLEQIGKALAARGHKLAIASRPEAKKAEQSPAAPSAPIAPAPAPSTPTTPTAPPEPPKTPAQEIGVKHGEQMAAKIEAKTTPPKSQLAAFMPGKNSDYPKPDPVAPAALPPAAAPAAVAPKPAPLAPPATVSLPPAPKKQPPRPEPSAMPKTEAELEREERAAMEQARPEPGIKKPVAAAKPTIAPKNNLSMQQFSEMVAAKQPMMFSIIKRAGVKNEEDIKEAVGEATSNALAGMHSYDEAFPLSTWLGEIAKNEALRFNRRRKTKKRGEGYEGMSLDAPIGDGGDGEPGTLSESVKDNRFGLMGLDRIVYEEQVAESSKALSRLPEQLAEVLKMSVLDGMSSEQIAAAREKATGKSVTPSYVRNQKVAAVKEARKLMGLDEAGNELTPDAAAPSLFDKLPKKYRRDAENLNFIRLLTDAIRHKYLKGKSE